MSAESKFLLQAFWDSCFLPMCFCGTRHLVQLSICTSETTQK